MPHSLRAQIKSLCYKKMLTEKVIKALDIADSAESNQTELKPSYNSVKTELNLISRQDVVKAVDKHMNEDGTLDDDITCILEEVPPVTPQPKVGRCKDCKYFEYDSVAKVNGMSLVVAHEICSKWGNGCKTKEYGYCFLFEPQESEQGAKMEGVEE